MSQGKSIDGRVELSTYFHTEQDMGKLIYMLNNRFGLICSFYARKQGLYIIVIHKESVRLLQTIVLPFMLPNTKHKICFHHRSTFSPYGPGGQRSYRSYTTLNSSGKNKLNPNYITGFADGESNFTIPFFFY